MTNAKAGSQDKLKANSICKRKKGYARTIIKHWRKYSAVAHLPGCLAGWHDYMEFNMTFSLWNYNCSATHTLLKTRSFSIASVLPQCNIYLEFPAKNKSCLHVIMRFMLDMKLIKMQYSSTLSLPVLDGGISLKLLGMMLPLLLLLLGMRRWCQPSCLLFRVQ